MQDCLRPFRSRRTYGIHAHTGPLYPSPPTLVSVETIFHTSIRATRRSSPLSCTGGPFPGSPFPGSFRVELGVGLRREEEGAGKGCGEYGARVVGRWQKVERRSLNWKQRLRSPTNAPAVSSIGGVGWRGGEGRGGGMGVLVAIEQMRYAEVNVLSKLPCAAGQKFRSSHNCEVSRTPRGRERRRVARLSLLMLFDSWNCGCPHRAGERY